MDRKPPFEWTDADRAKLVPDATVVVCWGDVGPTRESFKAFSSAVSGRIHLHDCWADLDICDPSTIEPPRREESGLVEALRGLIADRRVHLIARDQIESILKDHGHAD